MRQKNPDRLYEQRGLTLVEVLVALGIFSLALGIAFAVLHSFAHAVPQEQTRIVATMQLDELSTQLEESAHSSVAIYTPAGCGNGNGTGATCGSLRFYGLDSAGQAHFWGWDYNSASKTLTQCLGYTTSEGACASSGSTISNVLRFAATPELASVLAARYGLHGVKDVTKLMLAADPRVVAGNRVVVLQIGNALAQREVHLLQSGAPFTAAVLKGTVTPPPLGGTQLTANPAPVFFVNATAAAIDANANESNYGQYEPYLAQPWWNGSTASCVKANWNASTRPSDSTTFQLRPTATGSCSFTIGSHDQQSNAMPAYVAGPLTAMADDGPGTTLTLNVGGSGSVDGGKVYDANEAINGRGNLDQISFTNGCTALLSYGAQTTLAPATPSSSAGYRRLALAARSVGTCAIGVSDPFGDPPQRINITVNSILSVTPSTLVVTGNPKSTYAYATISEAGYSGPFSETNNCSNNAIVSIAGSTLTVRGTSPQGVGGWCSVMISGLNAAAVSVGVIINPDVTPTPTATATPTGTPSTATITWRKDFSFAYDEICQQVVNTQCDGVYTDNMCVCPGDGGQDASTIDDYITYWSGYTLTVTHGPAWIQMQFTGKRGIGSFGAPTGTYGTITVPPFIPSTQGPSNGDLWELFSTGVTDPSVFQKLENDASADGYVCYDQTYNFGVYNPPGYMWSYVSPGGMYCNSNVANLASPATTGVRSRFISDWEALLGGNPSNLANPVIPAWNGLSQGISSYYGVTTMNSDGTYTADVYYKVLTGVYYLLANPYDQITLERVWNGSYSCPGQSYPGCSARNVEFGDTQVSDVSAQVIGGPPVTPSPTPFVPTPTPCRRGCGKGGGHHLVVTRNGSIAIDPGARSLLKTLMHARPRATP